ncbi:MAG TPA: UbiA family prenyltransferase [Chthoniobacterales bacterium]|jgi:4-hydroxybenzoate polyprenyltransferase|nr:UbiA family prenyltransferase [Chthoniobacterales bacterium]
MSKPGKLRAWLVLARASNLPTVWSNCVAGCWLGGWNSLATVFLICLTGSLFYTGGMFLNDFCDVGFDREYKHERPIVTGQLTRQQVGLAALVLFIAGLLLALEIAPNVLVFGVILVIVITAYDFLHKRIAWAPLLMATCRFLLYLMAAVAGVLGLTTRAFGFAIGLALYVVGLSYLARGESRVAHTSTVWLAFLFAPILVALVFHVSWISLACALPLLFWICRALAVAKENVGRGVAALLAGIVLVDLLAVSPISLLLWIVFAGLFGAALLFQRYVPAT